MNRSLTVLLPVRDAQSTLAATVAQVLEMASDLNERFELLIIDDGSSDATMRWPTNFRGITRKSA